jgi:hypothetical protein
MLQLSKLPSILHHQVHTRWYYNNSSSWGFLNISDIPNRSTCDTSTSANDSHKLCWHTSAGNMTSGYRCGTTNSFTNAYKRVIFHAD